MKNSHKMPGMRALPYTIHFSHENKQTNKRIKEKQSQRTNKKPLKNLSIMFIIENPSFTHRMGLVYLAVTCYFFYSQFFVPLVE